MLTYVIRRLLLMIPTLIGMTAVVFFVIAMAPGGIGAAMMNADAQLRPEARRQIEEDLNERYGLNKPKVIQYLRWLNKVSPIGLTQKKQTDPDVVEARSKRVALQKPIEDQIRQLNEQAASLDPLVQRDRIEELRQARVKLEADRRAVNVSPNAGDFTMGLKLGAPNLGTSAVQKRPVLDLILERLPTTVMLQVLALPASYALAIWLGIQQAKRRGGNFDHTVSFSTLAVWCIPQIWVGVLLIGFLANEQYIRLFPSNELSSLTASSMRFLPSWNAQGVFEEGWLLDRLYHLILPVLCLTYVNFAVLSRLTRGALLDNLYADFVRTARAKGLPEKVVLYRHAFRNSLIPLITVLTGLLPAMIGGSVIVENIFGIPGMGKLAVESAQRRDFELLLSLTLVTGFLGLVAYLLTDIFYAIADPRVSYE
jgi:ABC-type dipeptide/oligopeptide/nickel transport system permease component